MVHAEMELDGQEGGPQKISAITLDIADEGWPEAGKEPAAVEDDDLLDALHAKLGALMLLLRDCTAMGLAAAGPAQCRRGTEPPWDRRRNHPTSLVAPPTTWSHVST